MLLVLRIVGRDGNRGLICPDVTGKLTKNGFCPDPPLASAHRGGSATLVPSA